MLAGESTNKEELYWGFENRRLLFHRIITNIGQNSTNCGLMFEKL